jgi:hypothetical protein
VAHAVLGAGAHARQEAVLGVSWPALLLVHVPVPALAVRITMIASRVMGAGGMLAVLQVLIVVLGRVVTRAGVPVGVWCKRVGAVRRGGIAGAGEAAGVRREVAARHGESGTRLVTGAIVSLRVAALVILRAGILGVPVAGVLARSGVAALGMAGIAGVSGFMAGVAGLMAWVAGVAGLMASVAEVTGARVAGPVAGIAGVTGLRTGIAGVTGLVAGIAGVAGLRTGVAGVAAFGMADIAGVARFIAGVARFMAGITGLVTGVAER